MSRSRRESAKIVFHIQSSADVISKIGEISLETTSVLRGVDDVCALNLVIGSMKTLSFPMSFTEHGKNYSVDKYLMRVKKRGRWSSPVESGGVTFRFGLIASLMISYIYIEEMEAGSIPSWDHIIPHFVEEDGFVQAWITDVDYDYWQNAKDMLLYKTSGRDYEHLPMKLNGLPPPLEQYEIDISDNPGRWTLRTGFVEAIGSTMWLSPLFWRFVGAERNDSLLASSGFGVHHLDNGIVKVVADECCFSDATTEEKQRRLRSLLYGNLASS